MKKSYLIKLFKFPLFVFAFFILFCLIYYVPFHAGFSVEFLLRKLDNVICDFHNQLKVLLCK